MSSTIKKILRQFYSKLVEALPMRDATFIAKLYSQNFLPGDLKHQIQSKETRTEQASHFLDHMYSDFSKARFNNLLNLMENSEFERLKVLAKEIQTKLRKRPADSKNASSSESVLKKKLKHDRVDVSRLKTRYLKHLASDETDWPRRYVKLALIKGEKVTRVNKNLEEITRLTLQGQVDEILFRKEPLNGLRDIFHYQNKPCPRLILIMGGPGIGKTTLAYEICIRWAKDEFLADDFDAIILIPLRFVQERSLEDLMKEYIGEENYHTLIKSAGIRCLVILEGLDEMAADRRQSDRFLMRLIKECTLLEEAIVVVTSRPHACQNLNPGRRIEVVGFGENEIREFVEKSFPEDNQFVTEFLTQLDEYPQLHSLCYVPMNLVMILDIYQCNDKKMPSTLTELYQQFIVMILQRQVKKDNGVSLVLTTADSRATEVLLAYVPQEAVGIVTSLSKLSYCGFFDWYNDQEGSMGEKIKHQKIIFTVKDLTQCGTRVTKDFDGFSLLKATHIHQIPSDTSTYNFAHLTIQEFLCALYISTLPQQEQVCLLKEHFSDYPNVFIFLCGLTGLESDGMCHYIFHKLRCLDQYVMTAVRCLYESKRNSSSSLPIPLSLLQICVYGLLPFDCLCISYVLSCFPIFCGLSIASCGIGNKGAELLVKLYPSNSSTNQPLKQLDLSSNHITELVHVIKIVKASNNLTNLILSDNNFGDRGMSLLFEELQHNRTLVSLGLDMCGLSEKGAILIGKLLMMIRTIEDLFMAFNQDIGDDGIAAIAEALPNSKITNLNVGGCNITFTGASLLAQALTSNQTIEWLCVYSNYVTVVGARRILQSAVNNGVYLDVNVDDIYLKDEKVKQMMAILRERRGSYEKESLQERNKNINRKRFYSKGGKRFYLKPQSKLPLSIY